MLVGGLSGQVEDYESSSGSFVVRMGDAPKSLLAGCVPDLHFNFMVIDLDSSGGEFDTDSRLWFETELVIGESWKKIGFSYTAI